MKMKDLKIRRKINSKNHWFRISILFNFVTKSRELCCRQPTNISFISHFSACFSPFSRVRVAQKNEIFSTLPPSLPPSALPSFCPFTNSSLCLTSYWYLYCVSVPSFYGPPCLFSSCLSSLRFTCYLMSPYPPQ